MAFLAVIVATGLVVGVTELRGGGPKATASSARSAGTGGDTAGGANSAVPGAGSPADPGSAADSGSAPSTPSKQSATTAVSAALPVSAATMAKIPAGSRQVVVVGGEGATSNRAVVRFFERGTGWTQVASWPGHIGKAGWTDKHVEGDLKTPTGVFTLTDAGGRLANPGTKLSYERSTAYQAPASEPGFGDSAADAFDYVIAIDYNRVRGKTPLDFTRPMGVQRGGGIWLHVEHDGPTHGCVSVSKSALKLLLTRLDPAAKPVIVMGPTQSL